MAEFSARNGSPRVKVGHVDPSGFHLYNWLRVQRAAIAGGRISTDRAARLAALGVTGLVLDEVFDHNITLALKAKALLGTTNIRTNFEIDGFRLGEWLAQVRHRARTGGLAKKWLRKLREAGFDLGYVRLRKAPAQTMGRLKFERGIALLESFRNINGHVRVSQEDGMYKGCNLGSWLHWQRRKWKEGRLSSADRQALSALGVEPPRTRQSAEC